MSDEPQANPQDTPAVPASAPFKPAFAPGVKPLIRLANAAGPTGPGLAAGPGTFNPGVRPPLGAPKPNRRSIEPATASVAASYKVSLPAPTESEAAIPVAHLVGSGIAAGVAITAAVLLFLKS